MWNTKGDLVTAFDETMDASGGEWVWTSKGDLVTRGRTALEEPTLATSSTVGKWVWRVALSPFTLIFWVWWFIQWASIPVQQFVDRSSDYLKVKPVYVWIALILACLVCMALCFNAPTATVLFSAVILYVGVSIIVTWEVFAGCLFAVMLVTCLYSWYHHSPKQKDTPPPRKLD